MKQILLFTLCLLTLSPSVKAQPAIYDGKPDDSLVFSFGINDTLLNVHNKFVWAKVDTSNTTLWDIGITSKPFFSSGTGNSRAIMTDTANPYPVNANDWFVLSLKNHTNNIITFDHKYETTAGHDGGIVEFSKDNGLTWENVMGDCHTDLAQGILTDNFYDTTDTLNNGEMAFSGTSNGWQTSRIQFFLGIPIKTTGTGGWDCISMDTIFVRFRFVSDDTAESLDGWMIDGLKVEYDDYGGHVGDVAGGGLKVYPNPSAGIIHFPAVRNPEKYNVHITDMMGRVVLKTPYRETLDLRKQPRGIYFYKITDGLTVFTGKMQLE